MCNNKNSKCVVIPGNFDPLTLGHIHLIKRAARQFFHIILAIMENPEKKPLILLKEREILIKKTLEDLKFNSSSPLKLEVISFKGSLFQMLHAINTNLVIRGIRNFSDINYELKLARLYRILSKNKIEVFFIFSDSNYEHINSTTVKQLIQLKLKSKLHLFLPESIINAYVNL